MLEYRTLNIFLVLLYCHCYSYRYKNNGEEFSELLELIQCEIDETEVELFKELIEKL